MAREKKMNTQEAIQKFLVSTTKKTQSLVDKEKIPLYGSIFAVEIGEDHQVISTVVRDSKSSPELEVSNLMASVLASLHLQGEIDYRQTLALIKKDAKRRVKTKKIRLAHEQELTNTKI